MIIIIQFLLLLSLIFMLFLRKNTGFKLFLVSILISMFVYPSISIIHAKQGFNLWIEVIVASLFPFFILNDLMISLGIPESLSKVLSKPFAKIFKTSGYGAYVFILSIFSGYPTGAKIVAQLIKENKITKEEGQKILNFASTSGPLFIVGSVGTGMMKNTFAGYIIFISHIIGAIINGLIISIFDNKTKDTYFLKNNHDNRNIFYTAIVNSLITTGLIGGYIIFFSVIIGLLNHIQFFEMLNSFLKLIIPANISRIIVILLQSMIEISNGCYILSKSSLALEIIIILQTFIISFSGLSIIMQVYTILYGCGLNIKKYILSKISHSIISSIVCYILLKLNLFKSLLVFNPYYSKININFIIQIMLIIILLLNLMGIKKSKRAG